MRSNFEKCGENVKYLLGLTLIFLLMTGGVWLSRQPYFQISAIEIVGKDGNNLLHYADKKRIFNAVRPYLTGSFFWVDLHKAQKTAERIDWVRSVRVDRIPPSIIKLTIDEYQPAARWVRDGFQAGLISPDGEIFQAQYDGELPEFDGAAHEQKVMLQQYESFNRYLKTLRLKILRLQYSPRAAWTMMLDNGVEVRLGKNDVHARMTRFIDVYQRQLRPDAAYLDYVDMRYPDAFATRLRENAPKVVDTSATDNNQENKNKQTDRLSVVLSQTQTNKKTR